MLYIYRKFSSLRWWIENYIPWEPKFDVDETKLQKYLKRIGYISVIKYKKINKITIQHPLGHSRQVKPFCSNMPEKKTFRINTSIYSMETSARCISFYFFARVLEANSFNLLYPRSDVSVFTIYASNSLLDIEFQLVFLLTEIFCKIKIKFNMCI